MSLKSFAPLQVSLPPVGEAQLASITLSDFRMNEKLAGVEQRVRELESLLSAATRERLRLMNKIGEIRRQLLEMEKSKAVLAGYEAYEVTPGWFVHRLSKTSNDKADLFACPEWHHDENVTILQVVNNGRQHTIYRCSSPSCRFLKTVDV